MAMHPRVDVQRVIQQLREAVGAEKGTQYWDVLRRFLLAKLSKREFDHLVREKIGCENIGLHNELIKAILVNAQSGQPPPSEPLAIFARTHHAPRQRVVLKQKKEGSAIKQKRKLKHRDLRLEVDPAAHKHGMLLTDVPDQKTKGNKRRRALGKGELAAGSPSPLAEDRKKSRIQRGPKSPHRNGARPRHSYSGMADLEAAEVAYEVRQHVASIGMNATQESIDYVRYAVHEYVNRIIDACRTAQSEQRQDKDQVITLVDLQRAITDLQCWVPPWNMAKLFEHALYSTTAYPFIQEYQSAFLESESAQS